MSDRRLPQSLVGSGKVWHCQGVIHPWQNTRECSPASSCSELHSLRMFSEPLSIGLASVISLAAKSSSFLNWNAYSVVPDLLLSSGNKRKRRMDVHGGKKPRKDRTPSQISSERSGTKANRGDHKTKTGYKTDSKLRKSDKNFNKSRQRGRLMKGKRTSPKLFKKQLKTKARQRSGNRRWLDGQWPVCWCALDIHPSQCLLPVWYW